MQLAYFLPILDAEIERLQKARDLLALVPSPLETYTDIDTTQTIGDKPLSLSPVQALIEQPSKPPAEKQPVMISSPIHAAALPKRVRRSRALARTELRAEESRPVRRKRLILPDTALRGHVPSGPVVVSAEEARRLQASKTAQTSRAAEIRKAGEEPAASSLFHWRSSSSDARTVDSLLQRLMSIGTETEEQATGQLASLGHSENFKAAHGSKLE
jgi:hypothetical protein